LTFLSIKLYNLIVTKANFAFQVITLTYRHKLKGLIYDLGKEYMTTAASSKTKYEAIIGLETHCQLNTKSKIFCHCSTKFDSPPNTNICPVCMGYPGVLPVLNEEVLNSALKMGIALNGKIADSSKFDRKQYFYPDLPKNYQISQYDLPIVEHGHLEIELVEKKTQKVTKKVIGVTRLHMEEDAGKLVHAGSDRLSGSTHSLVDFNRTGIPLLEIVSDPDLRSGQEAAEYAQELRRLVRYLGISDGNMQEGSLRCDVNISVRPVGQKEFGVKVEIKNMNSFSAIQKAIDYEIERQIEALENGEEIVQETRLWEEGSQRTISMRSKEGSSDYRYFPEPDLPPLEVASEKIEKLKSSLPELPAQKRRRYEEEFGLSAYDARVLSDDRNVAEYFEAVVAKGATAKAAANWVTQDIAAYLNNNPDLDITEIALKPEMLAELITLIEKGTISGKIAKEILPDLLSKGGSPKELIESKGLIQISDPQELEKIIDGVLAANPDKLEQYQAGKTKLKGFFVGEIMKQSGGKADPKLANQILAKKLTS
jgi:aspartyl-tRNA(Asn)/glutamyl-tRNA(Gln) amidotransferase subunit B